VREPFPDDARLILLLVFALEAEKNLARFLGTLTVSVCLAELIRQGQQEHNQGGLILGIGLQDIQTDAFGQRGFGEQAIPFGFFEGFLNPCLGNGLELELHGKVRLSNCESQRQARVS